MKAGAVDRLRAQRRVQLRRRAVRHLPRRPDHRRTTGRRTSRSTRRPPRSTALLADHRRSRMVHRQHLLDHRTTRAASASRTSPTVSLHGTEKTVEAVDGGTDAPAKYWLVSGKLAAILPSSTRSPHDARTAAHGATLDAGASLACRPRSGRLRLHRHAGRREQPDAGDRRGVDGHRRRRSTQTAGGDSTSTSTHPQRHRRLERDAGRRRASRRPSPLGDGKRPVRARRSSAPAARASPPGFQMRGYTGGTKTKPETQLLSVECAGCRPAAGPKLSIAYTYVTGEFNYYSPATPATPSSRSTSTSSAPDLTYPVAAAGRRPRSRRPPTPDRRDQQAPRSR